MIHARNSSAPGSQPAPMDDEPGYDASILSSPTAKMDFLRQQLARRGISSEGMSFDLLMLEWKYDLSVLLGNIGDWMRYIDRRFSRPGD
ncbi:hypothetical protein ACFFP0_09555 [Rhizobium puerariae]|uniref:Uncharacterized protein n=1 Tax=Rhizobium puerariae TaxID=1585791 RepID=A0ABV6AEU9_9HYPH